LGSFGGAGSDHFQWSDPIPLVNALPPVAPFTDQLLPAALRSWVMDVAERTQAPPEYVAVGAMVSLGAAVGRKVGLRPKTRDDWMEFPNLWGAVIGPPSWMKSPALDETRRPLEVIESRILQDFERTHEDWEAESEAAKVRRDGAKCQARKAAQKGQAFDPRKLVADHVADEPKPPRLIVNDATVSALCDVLRANPNGVLVSRDELAGLIKELDKEGMEGSRGFYLTGWSGKTGHTQDRIVRGTNLRIPHVCLSLIGGIQPARIAPLLRESIATGGGDGFLARFSFIVWPDSPGEYRAIDRDPDDAARRSAYAVYEHLYSLDPNDIGAESQDGEAPFLRLDPAAAELFTEWDVALRNRLRSDVEDAALAAHLGKYPKAVCAVALLDHLCCRRSGPVREDSILRALGWADFLESHARRIYASLGQARIDAARALLRHIQRGELESPFTVRDVYRRGWSLLADQESAHLAVAVLEAHHYVRAISVDTGAIGGRPTTSYVVNPKVQAATNVGTSK
jgi:putative DNA primase/helicase